MIKSHTLENEFLKIKTINIGASLYEVIDKRKKINLILNLGNYKNYLKNKPYLGWSAISGAISGVPNTACVAGADGSASPRGDSQEGSMLIKWFRKA